MGAEPLLDVRDVRVAFPTARGTIRAVDGVSLAVTEGDLVGVVGESGCGKSTLARAVLGLARPPGRIVGGQVLLRGRDVLRLGPRGARRLRGADIGFVPQNPFGALNPVLRIERQFANLLRSHRSVGRDECRRIALTRLAEVGISDAERVLRGYAFELSGGMAQRVVLAMALALEPPLLVADEPTTSLDVTVQRQILDQLSAVLAQTGRAMLLITHDLGVVAQYCQRVVVMYAGRVVETGPIDLVFERPAHPYTEALMGAIPRRGEELATLPGGLPDLVHRPPGCAFHDRCPYRSDPRCAQERPPLREVGPGQLAATFCDFREQGREGVSSAAARPT